MAEGQGAGPGQAVDEDSAVRVGDANAGRSGDGRGSFRGYVRALDSYFRLPIKVVL